MLCKSFERFVNTKSNVLHHNVTVQDNFWLYRIAFISVGLAWCSLCFEFLNFVCFACCIWCMYLDGESIYLISISNFYIKSNNWFLQISNDWMEYLVKYTYFETTNPHVTWFTFIYWIYWMHISNCIPIWLPSLCVPHAYSISWLSKFSNSQTMLGWDME